VCTNNGPKKLPPIPTAITSFNSFPVAPTYKNIMYTLNSTSTMSIYQKTTKKWSVYYPRSTADLLSKVLDLVKNVPNIWDNILSITLYNSISRSTKSYMKY